MPKGDKVLVMDPCALADPAPVTNLQLPREFDSGSRPEYHTITYLRSESSQNRHSEAGADLPRITNENELCRRPEVHDRSRPTPSRTLTRREGQIYYLACLAHVTPPLSSSFRSHTTTNSTVDTIVAFVTTSRLRITILGLNYAPEPTGNAPYTASLAEGLAAAGHSVNVIAGYPHYPEWRPREGYTGWTRREVIGGVTVTRLRHYVPRSPNAIRRMHMELSFGLRLMFEPWGSPDVILVVSPALFSSGFAILRARFSIHRPAIGIWVQDLYSRGIVETAAGGSRLSSTMAKIESWILLSADGVIAIHERFQRYIVGSLGIPSTSTRVIRNWTHLPAAPISGQDQMRASLGWTAEDVVVLHAGNMGQKQGLENVVAAARLAAERQSRVRFVLMGDGNQRKSLEADAQGVGKIDFLDPLPGNEFQKALAAADILLVNERPGVKEMAVPSKLTSYFSAGVPVVAATDKGSVTASEIETSGGGIRVDAGDPKALLDALENLSSDPDRSGQLARNGLKFRQVTLSKSNAIAHYDEFLTSLASARGR